MFSFSEKDLAAIIYNVGLWPVLMEDSSWLLQMQL